MNESGSPPGTTDRRTALAIFLFLSAVYLLFFTGSYTSIDEMAVFSMADSALNRGELSIDQLNWVQMRPTSDVFVGAYGADGRLYGKATPTLALLAAPLVAVAQRVAWLGAVQSAFFINILLTALAGSLLYKLGRKQGYSAAAAVTTALLFGLATPALPYARSLFPAPLAGLLLLASFLLLTCYGQKRSTSLAAFAGAFVGLAGFTRPLCFLFLPIMALYLFIVDPAAQRHHLPRNRQEVVDSLKTRLQARLTALVAFVLAGALTVLLYLAYNTARFAAPLEAGYAPGEAFSADLLQGLYILLLSPGKSLFLYAPLFLLLPPLWLRYARRQPAAGLTILLGALVYIAALALWEGSAGGWAWGPRLLMPIIPLLSVLLLPLFNAIKGSRVWRLAFIALLIAGLLSQLLGATVDYAESLRRLAELGLLDGQGQVFKPELAAHLQHLHMIAEGRLDLAWLSRRPPGPVTGVDWTALTPLLSLTVLTGVSLWLLLRSGRRRLTDLLLLASCFSLFLVAGATLRRYNHTRLTNRPAVADIVAVLEMEKQAGDALLSAAIGHSQTLHNLLSAGLPVYGAVNDPLEQYTPAARERLLRFLADYGRIWLLLEWTPPGDPDSGLEMLLADVAFPVEEWRNDSLRLALYEPAVSPPLTDTQVTFGDHLLLGGYSLERERVAPGDTLHLTLAWQALAPIPADYTVFVQLLNDTGELVAQADRRPVAGLRPTSRWTENEIIIDRHGLSLSEDLPAGQYRLQIGLYQWPELQRLPVGSGGDALILDDVITITIESGTTP